MGRRLAGIYGESDLLAMQCLRAGLWDGLGAAELPAACSVARLRVPRDGRPDGSSRRGSRMRIRASLQSTRIWGDLEVPRAAPRAARDPAARTRGSPGRRTAGPTGGTLRSVLDGSDLTAGDFVRWCKQVMDFLGQLATACGDPDLARRARTAIDSMRRGVVAVTIEPA